MKKTLVFFFLMALFFMITEASSMNVSLSDQGTGVKLVSDGQLVDNGNLTVSIYDNETGGNLVYSETFVNAINRGAWNVMLGENSSNPLDIDYGRIYYKDYSINGVDVDFYDYLGNTVERQFFYSPLGTISPEYLSGMWGIGGVGSRVSAQGMVLSLSFNEQNVIGSPGSETVLDSSGYNNHGSNNGAVYDSRGGFNGG